MNPATFLNNFGHIADAPSGIDNLRRLILSLAVGGKLAPQDPADEPASELLARVATERDHLPQVGRIRKSRSLPPVLEPDVPYAAPPAWQWTRLGSFFSMQAGKNVAAGTIRESGTYPCYGGNGIRGYVEFFNRDGNYPLIGRQGALCGNIQIAHGKFYATEHAVVVGCFAGTSVPWAALALEALNLNQYATATAQPGLAIERISGIPIPVPPVKEQHRIVERVRELMRLCDELGERLNRNDRAARHFRASALQALTEADSRKDIAEAWERLSKNWKSLTQKPESAPALRHTIRQLAIQGRIVSQLKTHGSASSEVERARRQKAALTGARKQPLIWLAEPPATPLPAGWVWATVDDLFLVTGGIQKTSSRRPRMNHYPYLRVANVQRDRLDLREIEHFELFEGELDRFRLMPGDVLVVEGNGSETEIGRSARWSGEIEDCVHQNHLIRCRPLLPGLEAYLLLFLNSPSGMETMKRLAVTTSGLYNLSVSKIRSIVFPLPPAGERERIKTRVDDLLRLCDELENGIVKQRDQLHRFAQSSVAALMD